MRGQYGECRESGEGERVSAITIKPAYLGGLSTARYLLNRCAEGGVRVRVDGPWCGGIGAAAVLHLAAGVEPELLIASCNLQAPLEASAMPGRGWLNSRMARFPSKGGAWAQGGGS